MQLIVHRVPYYISEEGLLLRSVFTRLAERARKNYGWLATSLGLRKMKGEELTRLEFFFLHRFNSVQDHAQEWHEFDDRSQARWFRGAFRDEYRSLKKLYKQVMGEWSRGF